jgi:hypothetical protein
MYSSHGAAASRDVAVADGGYVQLPNMAGCILWRTRAVLWINVIGNPPIGMMVSCVELAATSRVHEHPKHISSLVHHNVELVSSSLEELLFSY